VGSEMCIRDRGELLAYLTAEGGERRLRLCKAEYRSL
jgi:hypothetical protein